MSNRISPQEGSPVAAVQRLINTFIVPTSKHSKQSVKERVVLWMQIANNPSQFASPEATRKGIAELRRKARQNVKRLAAVHPEVVAEIFATVKPEDVR